MVDLSSGIVRCQMGTGCGDLRKHVDKDGKVTIAKTMMKDSTLSNGSCTGSTNKMNHWDHFCIRPRNTIRRREFAHPKRSQKSTCTFHTSITICCIRRIQFISVVSPSKLLVVYERILVIVLSIEFLFMYHRVDQET